MRAAEPKALEVLVSGERAGWLAKDEGGLVDRADELAELVKANLVDALNAFSSFEGVDELASRMVPRLTALCSATQRNIRVEGSRFKPVDIARRGV